VSMSQTSAICMAKPSPKACWLPNALREEPSLSINSPCSTALSMTWNFVSASKPFGSAA
jgi:hypothetical protein